MRLRERVASVPPFVAVPVVVVVELAATAALGRGQGWPGGAGHVLVSALLLAAEAVLVYCAAYLVGGRGPALAAGLLLALVPVVLAERYFVTGGGGIDYRAVYRHQVLPAEAGLSGRSAVVSACLFLLAGCLALARTRLPGWAMLGLSGAAAAAAAVVYPRAWIGLAAPVAAAVVRRAPAAVAAAAAGAGIGLLALVLFRHVPHVAFGWHSMGITLGGVREFTWSRRLLEYLPLAGVVGLALRSPPAAAFFGVLLVALVILPLAQTHDLTAYLISIVPGLPVYVLLTASIGFLVPRSRAGRAAAARAPATS